MFGEGLVKVKLNQAPNVTAAGNGVPLTVNPSLVPITNMKLKVAQCLKLSHAFSSLFCIMSRFVLMQVCFLMDFNFLLFSDVQQWT